MNESVIRNVNCRESSYKEYRQYLLCNVWFSIIWRYYIFEAISRQKLLKITKRYTHYLDHIHNCNNHESKIQRHWHPKFSLSESKIYMVRRLLRVKEPESGITFLIQDVKFNFWPLVKSGLIFIPSKKYIGWMIKTLPIRLSISFLDLKLPSPSRVVVKLGPWQKLLSDTLKIHQTIVYMKRQFIQLSTNFFYS